MSENTINATLRGLGFTQDEMTGHGSPASGAPTRSSANWRMSTPTVSRAYARADYCDERVRVVGGQVRGREMPLSLRQRIDKLYTCVVRATDRARPAVKSDLPP